MAQYSTAHKAVLQAFVRDTALAEQILLETINASLSRHNCGEPLDSLAELDSFLQPLHNMLLVMDTGLQLKKRQFMEMDGAVYWVLVNRKGDDVTKESCHALSEAELQSFKNILTVLAKSPHGNIVLDEVSKIVEKQVKAKDLLNKLEQGKWIVRQEGRNMRWTAGIRTLAELDEDLANLGAHQCTMSNQIVLKTKKYKQWYKDVAHEDFVDDSQSSQLEEEEQEQEEEEEEEEEESPKRKRSPRAGKMKKSKHVSSDEEDEDDEVDELEQMQRDKRRRRR